MNSSSCARALLAAVLVSIVACAPESSRTSSPGDLDTSDVFEIVAAWNARAASVQHLYGRGIFQVNWTDADGGSHVDQGDIDLWYEQPARVAIRCSKFGETISIFGSDGSQQWFYDARQEILYSGELESGQVLVIADQPFSAPLLLSVLGLSPLPESPPPTICWSDSHEATKVGFHDGTTMWLKPGSNWPTRRRIMLTGQQSMWIDEDPSRSHTIRLPGRSISTWPVLPGSITMTMTDQVESGTGSLVVFDELTASVEDEPMDRVFDLEHLSTALDPTSIRAFHELDTGPRE